MKSEGMYCVMRHGVLLEYLRKYKFGLIFAWSILQKLHVNDHEMACKIIKTFALEFIKFSKQ